MTVSDPARHPLDCAKVAGNCGFLRQKPPGPGGRIWSLFLLAIGAVLGPCWAAQGQPGDPLVVVIGPAADAAPIARFVHVARPFAALQSQAAWLAEYSAGVEPALLDPLRETDRLITEARRSAAELDEPAALRRLAEAERLMTSALAVPGAAAFYAEVQLQLGVTAAQLGLIGLAEASFGRAARLDPRRRLLAAEAAPEVVQLAARVFDDASSAPEGEMRIVTDAAAARVFVDDVERGSAPLMLRARAGVHALRIEAPGHVTYAALFDMAEGLRPEQAYALAVESRVAASQRFAALLSAAPAELLAQAARDLLQTAPEVTALTWLERDAARARRLVFMCDRRGCQSPVRDETGITARDVFQTDLSGAALAAARGWLHGTPAEPAQNAQRDTASLWQRWYFWSAVAATVLGAGVLIAIAAQPEPQRTLRVTVDPGDLR
jgi:hypothetical protein